MFGIIRKRDPLWEVTKRASRIENAIAGLASNFPRNPKSPKSGAHQLIPLRNALRDMQRLIGDVSLECKVNRVLSPIDAAALSYSFESIKAELRWLSSKQLPGDALPSRHPLFNKIVEEASRLNRELTRLATTASWTNGLVDKEKDPLYEIPRRLRAAIKDLDKGVAKNVSLEELERWCSDFPSIDWEDLQMVQRVANVYLLNLILFQMWEVRHRSEAPGRPLVLAIATSDFPDPELLNWCDTTYGYRREYHFAARYPSWRMVWRTSWYAF